ncbi:Putative LOC100875809, partial [Caligus rogercresseyi]
FMACLLEQFDCTENCPTLQRCSELSGVNSVYPGDNFVSGAENPSGVFFLPPLLSSEEDKERMFCVKEFFACKEPALSCKL